MTQIYNCKKRFGYTYMWTCNEKMQDVLFAYCEGRSGLWNMFFGWRKTNSQNQTFFWIPTRKLNNLIEIVEKRG